MNYRDFIGFVRAGVQKELGEEVRIGIHQVMKNNSVVLDGLAISEKDSALSPTIYLNDFYGEYLDGLSMPDIIDCIVELYRRSRVTAPFDADFYADYEKVRPRLACRLINREKNESLLEYVPHKCFLNLAAVVYYSLADSALGCGAILVYRKHLKNWGVSEEELFRAARENTMRLFPEEFMPMQEILERFRAQGEERKKFPESAAEEDDCTKDVPLEPMYVLTNRTKCFGAVCMMYDEVLQKIAGELGEDFWILPSSIHECIIVPLSISMGQTGLQEMVRQINREEVSEEEFLSDEVYLYQAKLHRLSL